MRNGFDCETYRNYFSNCAIDHVTGEVRLWERYNDHEQGLDRDLLMELWLNGTWIGFNSMAYDDFMISGYLSGFDNEKLFDLSQTVIAGSNKSRLYPWQGWRELIRSHGLHRFEPKIAIDIFNIPKGMHSLKVYAGRIGFPKLQELPIHWNKSLTDDDVKIIRPYNVNDVEATLALYDDQHDQIKLRGALGKLYRLDLYSKSDAQIAEAVIKEEMKRHGVQPIKGTDVKTKDFYGYKPPKYLSYNSPVLQERLIACRDAEYVLGKDGKMKVPTKIAKVIKVHGVSYKMGVGGLHSKEAKRSITAADDEYLCEIDVASFYPRMIINQGYAPSQYDADIFMQIYEGIVNTRLAAKATGDKTKADSLKIVVNASFGKFGNQYSALFSPELLIGTTMTGQLLLLKLIEMMGDIGIKVVSANTDGIVCHFHHDMDVEFQEVVAQWEALTSCVLERTDYKGLYSQSVNSYFAVKPDGTFKGKATFAEPGIGIVNVAPAGHIIALAAMEHIAGGRHYIDTIMEHDKIEDFCYIRKVGGGAEYDMEDVGGTVRWYLGKQFRLPMTYITSGNNVPSTHNAVLALDLPEGIPDDLDRGAYINEVRRYFELIGYNDGNT